MLSVLQNALSFRNLLSSCVAVVHAAVESLEIRLIMVLMAELPSPYFPFAELETPKEKEKPAVKKGTKLTNSYIIR